MVPLVSKLIMIHIISNGTINLVMVRRHRILNEELIHVVNACYRRLVELSFEYEEGLETKQLFKFLWRVTKHRKGNPHYPELNPGTIYQLIREIEKEFKIPSYLYTLQKK
jgi:hypothetical protein